MTRPGRAPLATAAPAPAAKRSPHALAAAGASHSRHPAAAGASHARHLAAAGVPRYLGASAAADPQVGHALSVARRGGTALPDALRTSFEAGLQGDFGAVRLHTDDAAAQAARGVQARAFTVGRDIVFGAGEYAPHTRTGRRLLAHELVHVTQQARDGAALQRDGTPGSPPPVGLAAESEATRQSLKFDTDEPKGGFAKLFNLKGTPVTADNVDDSFELETPTIAALKDEKVRNTLYAGLRHYGRSVFDLWPSGEDPKPDSAVTTRLNLVHVENMDLTPWGGPNAAFRFSCIGAVKKGRIEARIIVDELPMQMPLASATAPTPATPATPGAPSAPTPAAVAEKTKATPQNLTRDDTVGDALWTRVLRALAQIDGSVLARIHDVTFTESGAKTGPKGEAAEYRDAMAAGATSWTRKITLFQDIVKANDATFAFTLAHEIAHGIDAAPTQGAKGRVAGAAVHDLPLFKEAAKKDGGRGKAITAYGGTDDSEFFAECYAMYLQQPQTLAVMRPNIHAFFDGFAHPNTSVSPYANDLAGRAGSPAARKLEMSAPYAPPF